MDESRLYSLPQLIDLAQRSNPDTRVAWEQARQAALAVGMAESLELSVLECDDFSLGCLRLRCATLCL